MPTLCEPWPGNTNAKDIFSFPESEFEQGSAPRKTTANPFDQNFLAGLDTSITNSLIQRKRNRGGRCIAVAINRHDDFAAINTEFLPGSFDNADVGLVRN